MPYIFRLELRSWSPDVLDVGYPDAEHVGEAFQAVETLVAETSGDWLDLADYQKLLTTGRLECVNYESTVEPVLNYLTERYGESELVMFVRGADFDDVCLKRYASGRVSVRELHRRWKPQG